MKTSIVLSALVTTLCLLPLNANAAGGHGGAVGGGNKSGGSCKSTVISHFVPKHLSKVDAGSEFSFWVKGIMDPSEVEVTAKKIPVEMTAEKKSNFYEFKGKLPSELKSAARILVMAEPKKCPADKGILLIINK